jgi:hypothetical protein
MTSTDAQARKLARIPMNESVLAWCAWRIDRVDHSSARAGVLRFGSGDLSAAIEASSTRR